MAGYKNDWLSELKDKIDIIDVISRYVTLNQKGNSFWGCCPFHKEKTPSFAVNADRQHYHCFGCKEFGDAISFVQKMESIDFMDAVRLIASWVGFEVPEFSKSDMDIQKLKSLKDKVLNVLRDTARFYNSNLKDSRAKPHIEYMEKRGLTRQIQTLFGLGGSLDYESLPKHLSGLGHGEEEMLAAGVCAKKNDRIYDSLFKRLIFPIIDHMGSVVGFGGRLLEKSDFAKYKNTQNTLVFDKSRVLYGYNLVKKLKQSENVDSLIIVEGYMDAIALYKAGFKNVIASMGTALTEGQIKLIGHMVSKVYVSYDGDTAGEMATLRSLDLLKRAGLTVNVVSLPNKKDPDDVITEYGKEGYQKLIDEALLLYDYRIKKLQSKYDLTDKTHKQKFADEVLAFVRDIPSSTEQEEYIKQLKDLTGYTYKSLSEELDKKPQKKDEKDVKAEASSSSGESKAMRYILLKMLEGQPYTFEVEDISGYVFDDVHRIVYDYVKICHREQKEINPAILFDYIEQGRHEELDRILQLKDIDLEGRSSEVYFFDCMRVFKKRQISDQIELLSKSYDSETDKAMRSEIAKRLSDAMITLKQLKG